jgi:hypothetical protein
MMRRIAFLLVVVAALAGVVAYRAPASGHADGEAAPIYGVKIPRGYRDWKVIAVTQLTAGDHSQLRAMLGNDIAMKAYREGRLPFPDGAIIAALHWNRVSSEENNKVLADAGTGAQSFVPGSPVNVQFMVKDSKRYAATGGWGFADFKDGKPGDEALHKTCFPCHTPARDRDFVYTRYAP